MEVITSYLVKLENGTNAWLSVDKEVPQGATIIEERPMLIPSEGMVLHKIGTDEYCDSVWLKETKIEDYEEIIKEMEKENGSI